MSDPTTIPIEAVRTALGQVATLVGDWQARQTTAGRSYVAAGHDAVRAIDAAVRALYDARTGLIAELRADEIERAARVDAMIAEWQASRWSYEREDTAPGARVPEHVEGYRVHGREAMG